MHPRAHDLADLPRPSGGLHGDHKSSLSNASAHYRFLSHVVPPRRRPRAPVSRPPRATSTGGENDGRVKIPASGRHRAFKNIHRRRVKRHDRHLRYVARSKCPLAPSSSSGQTSRTPEPAPARSVDSGHLDAARTERTPPHIDIDVKLARRDGERRRKAERKAERDALYSRCR